MAPPPATPASSSKFLLSKRQPTQSQQQITPSQAAGAPRQFNATPRFSVSSTPHPASSQAARFSTPAILPPGLSSARSRTRQDLIDVESSPESSNAELPSGRERHGAGEQDGLISSLISDSPREEQKDGRSPKRRRISVSPVLESSPPDAAQSETLPADLDIDVDPSVHSSDAEEEHPKSPERDSFHESDDGHRHESPLRPASPPRFLFQAEPQAHAQTHQPFKPPPQFKQPSATASLQPQYPLPDAFSPQRRGAKYVNGGLAGELRDWLVDVKGTADASDSTAASSKARTPDGPATGSMLAVADVRRGSGFWLARGRTHGKADIRVVLAGEGRLSGLAGRRNTIVAGCTVVTLPPRWDIELDGQTWTVACDWYVAGQDNG